MSCEIFSNVWKNIRKCMYGNRFNIEKYKSDQKQSKQLFGSVYKSSGTHQNLICSKAFFDSNGFLNVIFFIRFIWEIKIWTRNVLSELTRRQETPSITIESLLPDFKKGGVLTFFLIFIQKVLIYFEFISYQVAVI